MEEPETRSPRVSLTLYVSLVGFGTCAIWWVLGYAFLASSKAAPMLGPVLGAMLAAQIYPRAKQVPEGYRRSISTMGALTRL
jgi:hypothetical protein